MALLKGDKFDEVVRDATMLGVSRIQPLATARTEVPAARTSRVDRWRRIAMSSAKQCGRAVVPPIAEPITLSEFIGEARGGAAADARRARPGGRDVDSCLPQSPPPASAALLVGPEGGWSEAEHRLRSSATRRS